MSPNPGGGPARPGPAAPGGGPYGPPGGMLVAGDPAPGTGLGLKPAWPGGGIGGKPPGAGAPPGGWIGKLGGKAPGGMGGKGWPAIGGMLGRGGGGRLPGAGPPAVVGGNGGGNGMPRPPGTGVVVSLGSICVVRGRTRWHSWWWCTGRPAWKGHAEWWRRQLARLALFRLVSCPVHGAQRARMLV